MSVHVILWMSKINVRPDFAESTDMEITFDTCDEKSRSLSRVTPKTLI